jgi:tetratricopeptide (TPR) repeat protein
MTEPLKPPSGDGIAKPTTAPVLEPAIESLFSEYSEALEEGRTTDAENVAVEVLALASRHVADQPSPDLALRTEATRSEDEADWAGAEKAYRQILALPEAASNHFLRYHAHADLSALYGLLGRSHEALEEARAGTAAARCEELRPLLGMALEAQACCALRSKQTAEARAAVQEILDKSQAAATENLQRARALVLRAACSVASSDWPAAVADLKASWNLLEPQASSTLLAGVHSAVARWWAVTARLRLTRGDMKGAAAAWQEAVERRRHVTTLPQLEGPYPRNALAQMLHVLGRALMAVGDSAGAEHAFTESRAIRQAIGLSPLAQDEETI